MQRYFYYINPLHYWCLAAKSQGHRKIHSDYRNWFRRLFTLHSTPYSSPTNSKTDSKTISVDLVAEYHSRSTIVVTTLYYYPLPWIGPSETFKNWSNFTGNIPKWTLPWTATQPWTMEEQMELKFWNAGESHRMRLLSFSLKTIFCMNFWFFKHHCVISTFYSYYVHYFTGYPTKIVVCVVCVLPTVL